MTQLHNVKLYNGKEIVYDENLPFRTFNDMDKDITDFINYIRPTLKFTIIKHTFVKNINPKDA